MILSIGGDTYAIWPATQNTKEEIFDREKEATDVIESIENIENYPITLILEIRRVGKSFV